MTATVHATSDAGTRWSVDGIDVAELFDSPSGLSGRELAGRLVELERVRRALEAATVAVLGEAERSDAYRDDGCISLSSWARCQVLWSKSEATLRVRELDLIRLCPEVETALASGSLGTAQVAELARARANPRVGDEIAEHMTQLLEWAATLDFGGFRTVVRRWEQLADVDGARQDHDRAHKGRRASFNRIDATFHLCAQFGVMQGTAMAKILEAYEEAEWQADWDAVKAEHGDQATPNMVARSQSQRRADAIYAIFIASVTGEGRTITDPLVHLVCDVTSFEDHLADTVGGRVPTTGGSRIDRRRASGKPGDGPDARADTVAGLWKRCGGVIADGSGPSDRNQAYLVRKEARDVADYATTRTSFGARYRALHCRANESPPRSEAVGVLLETRTRARRPLTMVAIRSAARPDPVGPNRHTPSRASNRAPRRSNPSTDAAGGSPRREH